MKISCQSCQAKYTIADEKVVGKIVKIRCKKCSATIVINGNETAAPAEDNAETNVYDYTNQPSAEAWTVNVSDDDQRTMTLAEIVGEYQKGVVHDETFCWKDGMSDWLPLREIEALYSACAMGPRPSLAQDPNSAGAPGLGALFANGGQSPPMAATAQSNGNGNGFPAPNNAAAMAVPAAARRAGGRAGGDLFGAVAQAGGEEDVMTSAPQNAQALDANAGKLTGQRNENSVLFSLNALTQTGPEAPQTTATGDGSGLIDIRALSTTMGQGSTSNGPKHVDDIMNLGGGGAFTAALTAPILAPPTGFEGHEMPLGAPHQERNKKGLIIGLSIGGVAIAALLAFFLARGKSEPIAATTPAPTSGAETTGAAASPGAAATPTPTPNADPAAAAPPPAAAAAPPPPPDTHKDAPPAHASSPVAAATPHASPNPGWTPPVAAPPPPAPPKTGGGANGGSLMDEIAKSVPKPAGGTPAASDNGGGGAPFDRSAAASALNSVNVGSCARPSGPTGQGHVSIVFSPSGNVASVTVDRPPFAGTPVGGCVAGKYRAVHIPAFSGSAMPVGKTFTIN